MRQDWSVQSVQEWFSAHVKLGGESYLLDSDQARAVADQHQNTLVVARAGSGKTRVIVAKTIFLICCKGYHWNQIQIFMFNRAAATEVNQRLAQIVVDSCHIVPPQVKIASTFHRFALQILRRSNYRPTIISETKRDQLIEASFLNATRHLKLNPATQSEALQLVKSFVARAGQSYPLQTDLPKLKRDMRKILPVATQPQAYYQKLGLEVYASYLSQIQPPLMDFNQLLALAASELTPTTLPCPPKYLMIDEYQDFSLPFYRLVCALRAIHPDTNLFAVGDDWQAINRFAGSDVEYFTHFQRYFTHNSVVIPLLTNYRSRSRIVASANQFMLKHYDSQALPAKAFQRRRGKIIHLSPRKLHFDVTDAKADALGDGRFSKHLPRELTTAQHRAAGQLLKQLYILLKRHPYSTFLFLHRHNFTTLPGVDLIYLQHALSQLASAEQVMSMSEFEQRVRFLTIHKSKGLEADIVVIMEFDQELLLAPHPHGSLFTIFGDTRATESSDQARLIYVALTRAKQRLYLLTNDRKTLLNATC